LLAVLVVLLKGNGKVLLHGDLICRYTLFKYISDIYVNGLCIISLKTIKNHDFVRRYFFTA